MYMYMSATVPLARVGVSGLTAFPCISILNSIPLARAFAKGYHWNWISLDLRDHTRPWTAFPGLTRMPQKTAQKSYPHLQPQFCALVPQSNLLYQMYVTLVSETASKMEPKIDTNHITVKM